MGKHTNRNIGIVVIAIVFGGTIGFLVLSGEQGITPTTGEVNVVLAPPLRLAPTTTTADPTVIQPDFIPISLPIGEQVVEVGEIFCKIKQSTLVHGVDARLLETIESTGIAGSPFIRLAFVTGTEIEVASYNVLPKVFCTQQNNIPIEVFIKEMQLTVRADYPNVNQQIVWTQGVTGSRLLNFGTGQGEQTLVNFYVPMNQVEAKLPNQDFTMLMNFEITGTIVVQYSGFMFEYIIPIYRADMETFDQIDIRKAPTVTPTALDSDGDKILDSADTCPTQPETFNGFQDADGCPDIPQCPSGEIVISDQTTGFFLRCEPTNPNPPETCESIDSIDCSKLECENAGGTFVQLPLTSILVSSQGTYCKFTNDPMAVVCPDGTLVTSVDRCPALVPVTTEEFLSGQIRMVGSTIYQDLSQDTFVIQEGIFFSSIGQIQPLTVTAVIAGQEREIERIEVEVYYIFPNTADAFATTLVDSDLNFRPTVRITLTEQRIGTPFIGTAGDIGETGKQQIPFGTGTGIGNGFLLSSKAFLARDIQALGTAVDPITADVLIGEGNSAEVTFIVDVTGDFTFSRKGQTGDFIINDAFVTFSDVTINNLKGLLKPTPCLGGQVPTFDVDGQQVGCTTAPQGDRDADGVSDVADQCPDVFGTVSNNGCPAPDTKPSPDTDGDGIPDNVDPDIDGDGIPNETDPDIDGDGIPNEDEKPPCEGALTVIGTELICVKGTIVIGGNNGEVCTLLEPQNCPTPTLPIDFNTLLIVGGIAFVIIGVTVAVLRRR